ncbi:Fc.00g046880.m01.CDS01 [Cosmosporella sp. VM-42]
MPDLWAEARTRLDEKSKSRLRELENHGLISEKSSLPEDIDVLVALTDSKRQQCDKGRWTLKIGGHELKLRDYATKIITWLQAFKEVGDIIVQYDPGHIALPWAAFRFILQCAISEREQMGAILMIVEKTSYLVIRGKIFERLYTTETTQAEGSEGRQLLDLFRQELTSLYTVILRALAKCIAKLSKSTAGRATKAAFQPGKMKSLLDEICDLEKRVQDGSLACEGLRSQIATKNLEQLLHKMNSPLCRVEKQVSQLMAKVEDDNRLEIMEWLSSVPFGKHHRQISRQRTHGTGEWLLQHGKFNEWHQTSSSAITLIYGIREYALRFNDWLYKRLSVPTCSRNQDFDLLTLLAGAGKTYLVSRVIDWAQEGLRTLGQCHTDEAFAYFYCNRAEENRRNPESILRSLVRQLCSTATARNSIHQDFVSLKRRLALEGRSLDVDICRDLLSTLTNLYPATTIILDALDECQDTSRHELMEVLNGLMESSRNPLKILISSRPDNDIKTYFRGHTQIEIQATDNQADIEDFVQDKLSHDKNLKNLSNALKREVAKTLFVGSRGMFQWAALQIQHLSELRLPHEANIRARLGKLPKTLDDAYREIWTKVEQLSDYEKTLAIRAFQWVLCSLTPLSTAILGMAVLINPDSDDGDAMDTELNEENINELCTNLLTYDEQTKVWRFCHLSAREFLEKNYFPKSQQYRFVATSCLKYLIASPCDENDSRLTSIWDAVDGHKSHRLCQREMAPEIKCFCTYVAFNWGWLVRASEAYIQTQEEIESLENERLRKLLKEFLGSAKESSDTYESWVVKVTWLVHFRQPFQYELHSWRDSVPELWPHSSPLFGMSVLGIHRLLFDWWEAPDTDCNLCNDNGNPILYLAMNWKQENLWRYLLHKGVEIGNALAAAITARDKLSFAALLEAGAEQIGAEVGNALAAAICTRDEVSFAALVEAGADVNANAVNAVGPGNHSALEVAVWSSRSHDNTTFVELVLEKGGEVNMQTENGNALFYALRVGAWGAARMLLNAGAEVTDPVQSLWLAAGGGCIDLIRRFLDNGADVNSHSDTECALINAAESNCTEAVKFLLKATANANMVLDSGYGTAILAALGASSRSYGAYGQGVKTIQPLLEAGADPNLNNGKMTPLMAAISRPLELPSVDFKHRQLPTVDIMHRLVAAGADVNDILPDAEYPTALSKAVSVDHLGILVQHLLDFGADPNLGHESFGSALAWAAFHGRLKNCRLLLHPDVGVDVNMHLGGYFKNVLYAAMAGNDKFMFLQSPEALQKETAWKRVIRVTERREMEHLKVIGLLFEAGVVVPMPMYLSLGPSPCSIYLRDTGDHQIEAIRVFHTKNKIPRSCDFPQGWGQIIWELECGQAPRLPIPLRLWRNGLHRPLPSRATVCMRLRCAVDPQKVVFVMVVIRRGKSGSFVFEPSCVRGSAPQGKPTGKSRWVDIVPKQPPPPPHEALITLPEKPSLESFGPVAKRNVVWDQIFERLDYFAHFALVYHLMMIAGGCCILMWFWS